MTVKMAVGARPATLLRLNLSKEKVSYFSGISKGLGLYVPIIYNRMERRTYDILIIIDWCLLGWFSWGRSFTINFVEKTILLLTTGLLYGIM